MKIVFVALCLLDKFANAAGNAKAFLLAALAPLGHGEEAVTEANIRDLFCGPANPLRGICITDETRRTINKGTMNAANKGKSMTVNNFGAVSQTVEDIKAQRAWLDANASKMEMAPAVAAVAPTVAVAQPVAAPVVLRSPSRAFFAFRFAPFAEPANTSVTLPSPSTTVLS